MRPSRIRFGYGLGGLPEKMIRVDMLLAAVGSKVVELTVAVQQDQPGFNVTAFELTEARLCFEGEAAALAATHITDEELDELDVLVRRIDRENRSDNGKEKADHEFHLLIARATRNAAVLHTIESLWRLRLTSPECKEL